MSAKRQLDNMVPSKAVGFESVAMHSKIWTCLLFDKSGRVDEVSCSLGEKHSFGVQFWSLGTAAFCRGDHVKKFTFTVGGVSHNTCRF